MIEDRIDYGSIMLQAQLGILSFSEPFRNLIIACFQFIRVFFVIVILFLADCV